MRMDLLVCPSQKLFVTKHSSYFCLAGRDCWELLSQKCRQISIFLSLFSEKFEMGP